MRCSPRLRFGAMLLRRYFSMTKAAQGAATIAPKSAFLRYTATVILGLSAGAKVGADTAHSTSPVRGSKATR